MKHTKNNVWITNKPKFSLSDWAPVVHPGQCADSASGWAEPTAISDNTVGGRGQRD